MKRSAFVRALVVILVSSLVLPMSTPAYALEKTAGKYTVVDSREYPIIFIPGMAGSTLDVGGGANAWPGSLSTNDEAFKVLALKEDGRTPLHGGRAVATGTMRYGAGVVYMIAGDWQFAPVYQGFYDYMDKEGYSLGQSPTGKLFFDFHYDFRQDNRRWTSLLDKKVDAVLRETRSDKVILVGHSMGGLQARLYMKEPNRAKKVAAVVFMGTPHHGSVMPFWAMTEGYNFGNTKLSDARMWQISANWEAGYQLLPDFPFIQDEKGAMHGIEWINTENWISTQEYNRYLQAQEEGKKHDINYGLPNRRFARNSVEFHRELGDSIDRYPGVKYYMIEGTGQETVQFLKARFEDVGLPKPVLRLEKAVLRSGDGTVPARGAAVLGVDGIFEVNAEHGKIPSDAYAQNILTYIRKEINNEDFRNDLVKKMATFADQKMAILADRNIAKLNAPTGVLSTGDKWTDLARGLMRLIMVGTPESEKIELRDEIRDMASRMLVKARANITIAKGVEKDERGNDRPEHLYIDVVNYEVKDVGTGIISGATMNITVDSLATFEEATRNTDSLAAAYLDGRITVKGVGLVNRLNAKIARWITKYFKAKLYPTGGVRIDSSK